MSKDFKQDRTAVCASRTVIDSPYELPVERDFVLPDYYPDIFRILRCTVSPSVVSRSLNGGRLSFEVLAYIKVLYLSENDKRINCIEQKVTLSKSVETDAECSDPTIRIDLCCDYVNCRVVNRRRLDVRGAVTAYVRVTCEDVRYAVTDAWGAGIQLKKQLMTYPARRINTAKRITVIEELELSSSKPSVGAVLRCGCVINRGEQKMIAGKLITKGEAEISMLYSCIDAAGEDSAETMRFSLPFSQIIDVEGIDESFTADIDITVAGCEIMPKGEDSTSLECELVLNVLCSAVKYESTEVVTDAFSTEFECTTQQGADRIEAAPIAVKRECRTEGTLTPAEGRPVSVYDCFAECSDISVIKDDEKNTFTLSGTVSFCAVGAGEDGQPFFTESRSTLEEEIPIPEGAGEDPALEAAADVTGCSYYLTDSASLEVKADVRIEGKVRSFVPCKVISSIEPDEDKPRERDRSCALKLCRCGENEDIWDIAKRYSASVSAILEENELEEDSFSGGMLLIPL